MNYQILLFSLLLMQSFTRRSVLTCHDVSLLGRWDTHMCCPDCHALAAQDGAHNALIQDTFHGQKALLCCHCSGLIHGSQRMPCHAMDYPGA